MKGYSVKELRKNHRLTAFEDLKEVVITNKVYPIPSIKKKNHKEQDSLLSEFE